MWSQITCNCVSRKRRWTEAAQGCDFWKMRIKHDEPTITLVSTWRQFPDYSAGKRTPCRAHGLVELRKRRSGRLRSLDVAGHHSEEKSIIQKQSYINLHGGPLGSLLLIRLCMHEVKIPWSKGKIQPGSIYSIVVNLPQPCKFIRAGRCLNSKQPE